MESNEMRRSKRKSFVTLGALTPDQWQLILKTNSRDKILEIAEISGWPGVLQFLKQLESKQKGDL
jgi:hypothetical protein